MVEAVYQHLVLEVPGQPVVMAQEDAASAPVADQATLVEVEALDIGHDQRSVGHAQQMGVVPAGFVDDLDR